MQVHELTEGMLFTLDCNTSYLYRFVENESDGEGHLKCSIIQAVAGWWPEGNRGKGQPAQWCYNVGGLENCNPYATVTLLSKTN